MYFFKSLIAMSLLAMGSVMNTAAAPACSILQPGNYNIESVGFPGELLDIALPSSTLNVIFVEQTPPQGQLGVWALTNADQGGYHIQNVGLGQNVSTIHLIESGLFLAQVGPAGAPASTYAIECAGSGQYVIKNVTADQLWTTVANGSPGGLAFMELRPADGSAIQKFLFHSL
ncbi:hypothetical protein BDZ97DRAFT_2077825 [Flammula alnicola]|nr:hypothetical protein BDZ97DRAFT_2077825 [Flammula alnicola]